MRRRGRGWVFSFRHTLSNWATNLNYISPLSVAPSTVRRLVVGGTIVEILLRDATNKRVVRVGVREEGADGQQHLDIVSAGLHCSFKMSRQIWPLLFTLQW